MSQVPRISKNSKLSPRLSELRILRILLANSSPGKRTADTYDIRMRRFPEAVSSLGISSQPRWSHSHIRSISGIIHYLLLVLRNGDDWEGSPRLSRVEALDPTLEGAELFEGEHEDAMTDPMVIIQVTLPVAEGSPSDHSQATGRRVS